ESVPALLDSGADQSLIAASSAGELGLPCTKEHGWVKVVDQPLQPIHGVARGVPVQIGSWSGEIDLHVVPMKDFKMVLGRDFITRMLPFTFMRDGSILFEDRGVRYEVPLERLPTEQTVLAAMEVSGGSEREHGQTVESKSGKARGTAHSERNLQRKRGGHAAQTCGNSRRGPRHSTRAALTRASRALVGESVTERELEGPSQGHRGTGQQPWHPQAREHGHRRGLEHGMERPRGGPGMSSQRPRQGRGTKSRLSHAGACWSCPRSCWAREQYARRNSTRAGTVPDKGVWNGLNGASPTWGFLLGLVDNSRIEDSRIM
ncbi:hypothetical protein SLEP1_g60444, partial [Rubroshorea leprosula]